MIEVKEQAFYYIEIRSLCLYILSPDITQVSIDTVKIANKIADATEYEFKLDQINKIKKIGTVYSLSEKQESGAL